MHNGIFKNLRQVMVFYNSRDIGPWPAPEVTVNVNREELGDLGLSEEEMADIIAFLHTLTDGYAAVGKSRADSLPARGLCRDQNRDRCPRVRSGFSPCPPG